MATSKIVLLWLEHTIRGVFDEGTRWELDTWTEEKKNGKDMSPIDRIMLHMIPKDGVASLPDEVVVVADAWALVNGGAGMVAMVGKMCYKRKPCICVRC